MTPFNLLLFLMLPDRSTHTGLGLSALESAAGRFGACAESGRERRSADRMGSKRQTADGFRGPLRIYQAAGGRMISIRKKRRLHGTGHPECAPDQAVLAGLESQKPGGSIVTP